MPTKQLAVEKWRRRHRAAEALVRIHDCVERRVLGLGGSVNWQLGRSWRQSRPHGHIRAALHHGRPLRRACRSNATQAGVARVLDPVGTVGTVPMPAPVMQREEEANADVLRLLHTTRLWTPTCEMHKMYASTSTTIVRPVPACAPWLSCVVHRQVVAEHHAKDIGRKVGVGRGDHRDRLRLVLPCGRRMRVVVEGKSEYRARARHARRRRGRRRGGRREADEREVIDNRAVSGLDVGRFEGEVAGRRERARPIEWRGERLEVGDVTVGEAQRRFVPSSRRTLWHMHGYKPTTHARCGGSPSSHASTTSAMVTNVSRPIRPSMLRPRTISSLAQSFFVPQPEPIFNMVALDKISCVLKGLLPFTV
ncbi:Aste57867_15371 [Aphanomyces stellatus]|uniref:Aste57867_15371 protein n=1 Tax=Aphanomyces stellatus TaxID=120398 RepID=A0A485L5V7_9STRA|nr:hypothetical protein As57867_015315 [Aphanomyces stellatus]VFT92177.1 Aste57867_15371 [Aphanomyces stellatus]